MWPSRWLPVKYGVEMAQGSTLYRVKLEISDVDRSVYESLSFRIARHPSEGDDRVVARILAYGLLYEPELEFSKGISDGDEPALWSHDLTGQLLHWVDVGTPGAERIHSASKKAERVSIVCHRAVEALSREMRRRKVHRAQDVQVLLLEPDFVGRLAKALERNTDWTLVRTEDELSITIGDDHFGGSVTRIALPQ